MAVYEFVCRDCKQEETLVCSIEEYSVYYSDIEDMECLSCGGYNMKRVFTPIMTSINGVRKGEHNSTKDLKRD